MRYAVIEIVPNYGWPSGAYMRGNYATREQAELLISEKVDNNCFVAREYDPAVDFRLIAAEEAARAAHAGGGTHETYRALQAVVAARAEYMSVVWHGERYEIAFR